MPWAVSRSTRSSTDLYGNHFLVIQWILSRVYFVLILIVINSCPKSYGENHDISDSLDTATDDNDTKPSEESGLNITEDSDMFEGDLKISKELIQSHFDFNFPGGKLLLEDLKSKEVGINFTDTLHRASVSENIFSLWKNYTVNFIFAPDVQNRKRSEIRRAMDEWERNTCLRFKLLNNDSITPNDDYIEFVSSGSRCYSSAIGRKGGRQLIGLPKHCSHGLILHEIGHALGFWHEHSRPDRDNYIDVHRAGKPNANYVKILDGYADFQGTTYDYSSIMHYPLVWGRNINCRSCFTLSVNNVMEYKRQGSPKIGRFGKLSDIDIKQTNRLYSCPNRGVFGFLSFQVKVGKNFQQIANIASKFIIFKAIDSEGNVHIRQTSYARNARDPVWNELVMLGENEWQFFRIQAYEYSPSVSSPYFMSMSQTIVLSSGWHQDKKHCENLLCKGYVMFDYGINPRRSVDASLRMYVNFAYHLIGNNSGLGQRDPYVLIETLQSDTTINQWMSKTIKNTLNPVWDQWLYFGCKKWNSFFIQLKDENVGIDDNLSDREWVQIYSGSHSDQRHDHYGNAYLSYDYELGDCP